MKQTIAVLSMVLLLVVTAGAWTPHKLALDIPFDFFVGEKAMPAGNYMVDLSRANDLGTITIRNQGHGHAAIVSTIAGKRKTAEEKNQLVFRRYGEKFFLAEVWESTLSAGRTLPTSGREYTVSRNYGEAPVKLALVFNGR